MTCSERVGALLDRGVQLPDPAQVFVDDAVQPERIGPGVVLHPGTRLHGARTFLAAGAQVGTEGPATLRDAVFGPGASIASGYVEGAVLLRGASLGHAAHVRPGTLLEEEASTGHCVGLKQTILLSFVTLGSLINFCDVLMAGGTSRRDHSEVGSGFIHFNFTPWGKSGDKATPSLIGDVARGVFLDQGRVFLGGSSGLVGPRTVGFGSVTGAGQVVRRDVPERHLVIEAAPALTRAMDRPPRRRIPPIVKANAAYMGQLAALRSWYREVRAARAPAGEAGETDRQLAAAAVDVIDSGLAERWKRLAALLAETGRELERPELTEELPCPLLGEASPDPETDHVDWVQALGRDAAVAGRDWLAATAQAVADRVTGACLDD